MYTATRPAAAELLAQHPRYYHTQLYKRAQRCPVYSRGRQVCTLSFQRGCTHLIHSATVFDDPLQRIRQGQIAQVPILLGSTEDDGGQIALELPNNISAIISEVFGPPFEGLLTPYLVRALYPGLNDSQVIAAGATDVQFRWCVPLSI